MGKWCAGILVLVAALCAEMWWERRKHKLHTEVHWRPFDPGFYTYIGGNSKRRYFRFLWWEVILP